MVNRFKKHIAACLAFCLAFGMVLLYAPGIALAAEYDGFTYSVDGSEVTVTGYTGGGGEVEIPDTIDAKPVVAIGANAFSDQTAITSVVVPATVASIGDEAFLGCIALEKVYFKDVQPAFGTDIFTGVAAGFRAYHHLTDNSWDTYVLTDKQPYVNQTLKYQDDSTPDSVSMAAVTGGTLSPVADPGRDGYTFEGWYDNAGYSGDAWDFASGTVTDDITLYAKWTPVPPGIPSSVSAVSASYNSIRISWDAVPGADGYYIYRATTQTGTYTPISGAVSTQYTNTRRITGQTYYYKVCAFWTVGAVRVYSTLSPAVQATPVTGAPKSVTAVSASYTSIRISWKAVAGADGYMVYRSNASTGAYSAISGTRSTGLTNTKRVTGQTYYYKVRSYKTVGATRVYGEYSTVVSAAPLPAAPTSVKAVPYGYTGIRVSWGKVSGANGYVIYRASSSTGTYTPLTALTKTNYTSDLLRTGKTYYFKVRAYHTENGQKVYSNYSQASYCKPGAADAFDKLIETAQGELGYEEVKANPTDEDGWTKYAEDYPIWKYSAWCACFVTWCAKQEGMLGTVIPKYSWVLSGKAWYQERGRFRSSGSSYVPKKGDVIFFHEPDSPTNVDNHTGLVEAYDAQRKIIYTIEGNIHDSVDRDMHGRNDAYVTGFGVNGGTSLGQIPIVAPWDAKARSFTYTSIRLNWTKKSSACTYQIYRSASAAGPFSLLATTTSDSYIDSGLTTGNTYYYKLRGYRTIDGRRVYSVYTQVLMATAKPSTPASVKAESTGDGIMVSWRAVSGATQYETYRATSKTGTYKLVGSTAATSYTDSGGTAGKTYYYRVRTYHLEGGTKVYSGYSVTVSATA